MMVEWMVTHALGLVNCALLCSLVAIGIMALRAASREKPDLDTLLDAIDGLRIAIESNSSSEILEHQGLFKLMRILSERTISILAILLSDEESLARLAEARRSERDAASEASRARDKEGGK